MNSEVARSWLIRTAFFAVVVLLAAWIANNTYWDDVVIPTPLKGEAATNPQYAVRVFLESLDVRVKERHTLDSLPPANAAIVMTDWHWDLIDSRRDKLEGWVRAGGRLIADNSLTGIFSGFSEFAGIELRVAEAVKKKAGAQKRARDSDDTAEAGVDESVEKCARWNVSIDAHSASGGRNQYSLCNLATLGWLVSEKKPIWAVRDKDGLQAVRVPIDEGSVTVINAKPFGNRTFRDVDRGALFVAATQLQRYDEVWLLTEADHPSLLSLIWQYGAPVVIVFALFIAVISWRNAVRFGPLSAPPDIARRSLAEQIRGTGWFIVRLGGVRTLYAAMLRALNEVAAQRIFGYDNLTPERKLAALVAHTGLDSEALKQAMSAAALDSGVFARRQSRHHLYRAIATLETARRVLLYDQPFSQIAPLEKRSEAHEASHGN
jgi:hypothetical protein